MSELPQTDDEWVEYYREMYRAQGKTTFLYKGVWYDVDEGEDAGLLGPEAGD